MFSLRFAKNARNPLLEARKTRKSRKKSSRIREKTCKIRAEARSEKARKQQEAWIFPLTFPQKKGGGKGGLKPPFIDLEKSLRCRGFSPLLIKNIRQLFKKVAKKGN